GQAHALADRFREVTIRVATQQSCGESVRAKDAGTSARRFAEQKGQEAATRDVRRHVRCGVVGAGPLLVGLLLEGTAQNLGSEGISRGSGRLIYFPLIRIKKGEETFDRLVRNLRLGAGPLTEEPQEHQPGKHRRKPALALLGSERALRGSKEGGALDRESPREILQVACTSREVSVSCRGSGRHERSVSDSSRNLTRLLLARGHGTKQAEALQKRE